MFVCAFSAVLDVGVLLAALAAANPEVRSLKVLVPQPSDLERGNKVPRGRSEAKQARIEIVGSRPPPSSPVPPAASQLLGHFCTAAFLATVPHRRLAADAVRRGA